MSLAVVFDLDGTLVDSIPDITAAVNRMLTRIGEVPMDRAQVQSYVGNGAPTLVRRVLASRGVDDSRHDDLLAAFLPDYAARAAELSAPYPGVGAALARLTENGHRLAICTNKPVEAAIAMLGTLGLSDHFRAIIGGGSLPQTKPDPAPLHAAIDSCGGGPALFVGDSEVDLHCGVNAGVPVALFTKGYLRDPIAATLAVCQFGEFADLPDLVASFA